MITCIHIKFYQTDLFFKDCKFSENLITKAEEGKQKRDCKFSENLITKAEEGKQKRDCKFSENLITKAEEGKQKRELKMALAFLGELRTFQNKCVLDELEEGDLVEFPRGPYSHWGVYVGEGNIVHLSGAEENIHGNNKANDVLSGNCFTISGVDCDKACVKKEDFWNVVEDSLAKKNNEKDKKFKPLSPADIKNRALSKIGPIPYSILWSNCEHFAAWCRNDTDWSEQTDTVLKWGVTLGALAVVGGIVYAAFNGGNDQKK